MTIGSGIDTGGELDIQSILGMIAGHGAVGVTLTALCRYLEQPETEPGVAFFVFCEEAWILAAQGQPVLSASELGCLSPSSISEALFVSGVGAAEHPFARGWARHLHSGAGELLGMLVGFCHGPALPFGTFAARVEYACRLAVIALEQNNLMREAAFRAGPGAALVPLGPAVKSEVSLQDVARMIAQQRPVGEILASLCGHMGPPEAERQMAFFLVRDEVWTLAAKGDLSPPAEDLLARIDPAALSNSLLYEPSLVSHEEYPTEFGWARHLCSETGELLGMLVGFAGGPTIPAADHATRIESVCRFASLAIEQINLIEELSFQARHDAVSGLFNRTYYERGLASVLDRHREAGGRVALLYINLDRFRSINDVLGLAIGTRLLKHIGFRLRQCVRANNLLARVGGDEFALVVPDAESNEEAQAIANRLLLSLATPFTIDGHELFITASVGVACSSPDSTPESLEREAYLALYHAKRAGKARYMFFQPGMSATPPERLEIEKRLRCALERKEMVLYYQPQIHLASNRIRGAEALLRWRPEGLGVVSPAVFLPVLEETGLIVEFGRWVLHEACRQAKQWIDEAGLEVRIGVNVSALQLTDPSFVDGVRTVLENTGFPAGLLELELTESLLVDESGPAASALRALANTGIHLALDDFGTGHSCLSYLHRLPFGRLKIDQSFVRIIGNGEECPPLLQNIIRMAENLGMTSIAEGVETPCQADLLRRHGCSEAQGYYFSRPIPAEDFVTFCLQYPRQIRRAQSADAKYGNDSTDNGRRLIPLGKCPVDRRKERLPARSL